MKQHLSLAWWIVKIPFFILEGMVNSTIYFLVSTIVPARVRDWFGGMFDGPGGLTRKPFSKWPTL